MTAKSGQAEEISHTDIFIFNDDPLRRIDSYQRDDGDGTVKVGSRRGDKILVAIANSPLSKSQWRKISSLEGLMEEVALLERDDSRYPLMSGMTKIRAGSGETYQVKLDRLVSEVCLRSIKADFSGREYEGMPLEDVRVYLTNVNASCRILRYEDFRPELIVNPGYLDMGAVSGFKDQSMVLADLANDIGEDRTYPGIKLYCYPNDVDEETAGSPFTRLVIEGSIDGHKCWYPITINRGDFGIASGGDSSGIGRNMQYVYDIILNRAGTDGPDIPISMDQVSIVCSIEQWDDKEDQSIAF